MKTPLIYLIICLSTLLILNENIISQNKSNNTIIIKYKDRPIDSSQIKNNKELTKIIDKHKIIRYKQFVPFANDPELRKIYSIEVDNNSNSLIKELKATNKYSQIRKSIKLKPILEYNPTDSYWSSDNKSWHLRVIEADNAWDITKGSQNVKIAIVDTKFDLSHPDLQNMFELNYDPFTLKEHTTECSQLFSNNDHGTMVAGFAIAENDGGGGYVSVAGFNTKFFGYHLSNCPCGYIDLDTVMLKCLHASTVMGADILNISWHINASLLGISNESDFRNFDILIIKEILNNGTNIVVAAGNDQNVSAIDIYPFTPLIDERIIVVSGTYKDDNHTAPEYDEYGEPFNTYETTANYPEVDICAPAYNLYSLTSYCDGYNEDGYISRQWGTSLATPIVSGTCALMKSVNSSLTPSLVQDILKKTADPINDENLYSGMLGAGRVNAYCAVYQSWPINLSGSVSGSYTRGIVNLNNTSLSSNLTINAAEVNINGTFLANAGSTLIINNVSDLNCPELEELTVTINGPVVLDKTCSDYTAVVEGGIGGKIFYSWEYKEMGGGSWTFLSNQAMINLCSYNFDNDILLMLTVTNAGLTDTESIGITIYNIGDPR